MPAATLTSKGQITIPKQLREALGLKPGDCISFELIGDGVVEMRALTVDLRSLAGMIKPTRTGVTLADMDQAIADSAAKAGLDVNDS